MGDRFSSTIRWRKLGFELRRARTQSGTSVDVIAKELEISQAKLSRFETGKQSVPMPALIALLTLYGFADRIQELAELQRSAREPGWWQEYGVAQGSYVDFESGAREIRWWHPNLLPVQPEEYCRALLKALRPDQTEAQREKEVAVRQERRKLLESDGAPKLWLIVGEAALRTTIGGAEVMTRTLKSLLALAERTNITFQILPFDAGEHAGLEGPFAILDYEPPETSIGYTEYATGTAWLEKPSEMDRVRLVFDHLQSVALPPKLSTETLRNMIDLGDPDHGAS